MTTTKKSTRKPAKKTAKKGTSQFHAVRAMKENRGNWIETTKDYNEKYVLKPFETGKDFVEELRDDFRSAMDDFIDGGKGFYKGLQKDTRKAFEDIVDKGKNLTDKIPLVNTMEEGITKGLKSVPDRLNLPNKKDVETLAKTVKTLNRKINALSKAQAA